MTRKKASPARPWERAKVARRVLTRDPEWAATAITALVESCHAKQADAVEDPGRFISLLCPRGTGKTTAAQAKLLRRMMRKKRARCLFIALTKESAARIVWDGPEGIKSTLENLGVEFTVSETKKTLRLTKNGSTLELGGVDDLHEIEKYRGVTFHAVVIDEGASHNPKLLDKLIDEILAPRLDGWLMLIGTAGHILSGPFYHATRPSSPLHRPYAERDDAKWRDVPRKWSSHYWTLEDGAAEVEEIARAWAEAQRTKVTEGWPDNHPKWKREYLAIWAADDTDMVYTYRVVVDEQMAKERGLKLGEPWNQWEPKTAGPMQLAVLPADVGDWHYVVAFDKGLAGAFAVDAFAFSAKDPRRQMRHVYGFESPVVMTCRALACQLLGTKDGSAIEPRTADRPAGLFGAIGGWPSGVVGDADEVFLKELADVYGVAARKADRREDQKVTGIAEVNGDLFDGRILVLKGSKLDEQLTNLQWKRDENGAVREDKGQPNHSADNLVNARKVMVRLFETGAVEAPPAPTDPRSPRGQAERTEDARDGGWEAIPAHLESANDGDWSDFGGYGSSWGDV
jgi:hypothetical protein